MKCPNLNDKVTKAAFNKMIVAFGGHPLTEDEFRSSTKRAAFPPSQKTALSRAHKLYDNLSSMSENSEGIDFLGMVVSSIHNMRENVIYTEPIYDEDGAQLTDEDGNPMESSVNVFRDLIERIDAVVRDPDGDGFLTSEKILSAQNDINYYIEKAEGNITYAMNESDRYSRGRNPLIGYLNTRDSAKESLGFSYGDLSSVPVSMTVADYYDVASQEEFNDVLKRAYIDGRIYIPVLNIPITAPARAIAMLYSGHFSLDLIPEADRAAFMIDAAAYINGGAIDNRFNSIFDAIGKDTMTNIVNYNAYLGADGSINYNGKIVGSFELQRDGSVTISNESAIIPYVIASAKNQIVINNASQLTLNSLSNVGFSPTLNKNKLYLDKTVNSIHQSVYEKNRQIEEFQNKIKTEAVNFFNNIKASQRIVSPAISMLLDTSQMDIDELLGWVEKTMMDSNAFITKKIKEAYDPVNAKQIGDEVFTSMHIIQTELLPFNSSLVSALETSKLSKENAGFLKDMKKLHSKMSSAVDSFMDSYSLALSDYLVDRFGFDPSLFEGDADSKVGASGSIARGRRDIKRELYYLKYPETSTNTSIRKTVALIKDIMSERAFADSAYPKITQLRKLLKSKGISSFDKYMETKGGVAGFIGAKTGYLIDKVRWGDFADELDRFGRELADKKKGYSADGLYDRTVPEKYWKDYRKRVNEWIKTNTVLPMDESYLDAISSLSKDTYIQYIDSRSHLTHLFSSLSAFDIVNETDSYVEFMEAYKDYMYLFSEYDYNGNKKSPLISEREYKMFSELSRFKVLFDPDMSEKENVAPKSSKFEELLDEIDKSAEDAKNRGEKVIHARYEKFKSIFYGYTPSENKTRSTQSKMVQLIKLHTANGFDRHAFMNADESTRSMFINEIEPDPDLPRDYSTEFYELKDKYISDHNGVMEDAIEAMERDFVCVPGTRGKIANPMFCIFINGRSSAIPSSIFSFDPDTFESPSTNPDFDNNSPYKLQPNPNIYSNPAFDKLSDFDRHVVDRILEILVDINNNNGTISMYGPLLPQKATDNMLNRGIRAVQGTVNPLSMLYPIYSKMFYNNDSIGSVIGFRKEANIPYSLYAKNTKRLDIPNTISRDLPRLLSSAYTDSLTNMISSKKLFAFQSIIDRLNPKKDINNPDASSLITEIVKGFVGIDTIGEENKSKGNIDIGSIVSGAINYTRKVHLSFKWRTITANILNAFVHTANDGTFISRRDLAKSIGESIKAMSTIAANKFTNMEFKESHVINMMRLSGVLEGMEDKHATMYGTKMYRFILENFWLGFYQLSDFIFLFPISKAVFDSIKYHNGKFYTRYQYIDEFAERKTSSSGINYIPNKERRRLNREYKKIKETLYNAYEFDDDGVHSLKREYYGTNADKSLELARSIIKVKHRAVAGNKSQSLSPSIDNVFSPQIMMYRGWQINAINSVIAAARRYDPVFRQHLESQYNSLYQILVGQLSKLIPMLRYYKDLDNITVDRQNPDQYRVDNANIAIRNMMTSVISLASSVMLYSIAIRAYSERLLSREFGDDDDELSLSWMDKAHIAGAILLYRLSEELNSEYNAFSAISSLPTQFPIFSIIKSAADANIELGKYMELKRSKEKSMFTDELISDIQLEKYDGSELLMYAELYKKVTPGAPGILELYGYKRDPKNMIDALKWSHRTAPGIGTVAKYIDTRKYDGSKDVEVSLISTKKLYEKIDWHLHPDSFLDSENQDKFTEKNSGKRKKRYSDGLIYR